MKHVYTVRYESIQAFSTARKAVEYLQANFEDWCRPHIIDGLNIQYKEMQEYSPEALIQLLNKDYWLEAKMPGCHDTVYVNKCEVR